MSWFWAACFAAGAIAIVITREPMPWWWCALVSGLLAWQEVGEAIRKRRG